jgi:uncharacterized membrane protein YqiK
MTQGEARKALAETWRFNRSGGRIELREVALIKVIEQVEANRLSEPPQIPHHVEAQAA